jgi:hypothetical protein
MGFFGRFFLFLPGHPEFRRDVNGCLTHEKFKQPPVGEIILILFSLSHDERYSSPWFFY